MEQGPNLSARVEAVKSTIEIENAHTSGAYSKRPLTIVRGESSTLFDETGKSYLDFTSGMGVALLGHGHPGVSAAIAAQARTLITSPEIFYNDRRAEFYEQLSAILPDDLRRYFLCNSGAEAIEGSLKIARLLTGRTGIVAAKRAFHGRTLGALGLTWNPQYRESFAGWTPHGVTHISFDNLETANAAITDQTAAVVIEAVQGESGVYPANIEFLQGLRNLCDERGAMLILDEIQTGLGRTGRWFGFQHAGIMPDIVALGKGVAGGVPMGVVAWREKFGQIEQGKHSSTFGGNPLACAAGVATLAALRDIDAPALAAELGSWLLRELQSRKLAYAREVRGIGLMIGIELRGRVTPVIQALQERGILALVAGKNVLRLLPPLIITRDEIGRAVEAVKSVLNEVTG